LPYLAVAEEAAGFSSSAPERAYTLHGRLLVRLGVISGGVPISGAA